MEKYTLQQLESALERMEPGTEFLIYGHNAKWKFKSVSQSGACVLVSDLKKVMMIEL